MVWKKACIEDDHKKMAQALEKDIKVKNNVKKKNVSLDQDYER